MKDSSKRNSVEDRDFYSNCLLIIALLGLGLKIPFILSAIIQGCLLACTMDVAYRYFRIKNYAMSILKIIPLILIGLFDSVGLTFK